MEILKKETLSEFNKKIDNFIIENYNQNKEELLGYMDKVNSNIFSFNNIFDNIKSSGLLNIDSIGNINNNLNLLLEELNIITEDKEIYFYETKTINCEIDIEDENIEKLLSYANFIGVDKLDILFGKKYIFNNNKAQGLLTLIKLGIILILIKTFNIGNLIEDNIENDYNYSKEVIKNIEDLSYNASYIIQSLIDLYNYKTNYNNNDEEFNDALIININKDRFLLNELKEEVNNFLNIYLIIYKKKNSFKEYINNQYIQDYKIFFETIKTIFNKRKKEFLDTGKINPYISEEEYLYLLSYSENNTILNGFYFDNCDFDEYKDKPLLLYLILNFITTQYLPYISPKYGIYLNLFKNDIIEIYEIISEIINKNKVLDLLIQYNKTHPEEFYYIDDNDLVIISGEYKLLTLKGNNFEKGNNNILNIGYSSEFEGGKVFIHLNQDGFNEYPIDKNLLTEEIVSYMVNSKLMSLLISNDGLKIELVNKFINFFIKELNNIKTNNSFTNGFGIGKIEELDIYKIIDLYYEYFFIYISLTDNN